MYDFIILLKIVFYFMERSDFFLENCTEKFDVYIYGILLLKVER